MNIHVILTIFLFFAQQLTAQEQQVSELPKQSLGRNSPVGTAKGIFPGRVIWSHAPGAACWDGSESPWFEDKFNPQEYYDDMIRSTVTGLSGTKNEKKAWNALFRHFNADKGKGNFGYRYGEKIAVKLNQNNTYSHRNSSEINASPQMVLALLRSLVHKAGVPESAIYVTDPSRFITDNIFEKCSREFPGVHFVDNSGGEGREKSEYEANAMHYSAKNGKVATGIATVFTEADYNINVALLKGHEGQGVTLCGKNWYGSMSINADWRKNHHNNFSQNRNGTPKYVIFVDFMGHPDLGGKTLLWLIDGTYGCRNVGGKPGPKWDMEPFGGEWPCSLFGSMDPVAIDMVANDFLISQFPHMRDTDYSDMYLMEAALAENAPSGTFYDPDGDGNRLQSLGVAEHWNNASDKKYSRNLGKSEGIELVYKFIRPRGRHVK